MKSLGCTAFVVIVLTGACAERHPSGFEQDSRFVGRWLVDQPTHGGYEATIYDLSPEGDIRVLGTLPDDYLTGTVSDGANITCVFGDSWHAGDSDTLYIEGVCSDGAVREVALGFSATNNAVVDPAVVVLSVGEDAGWTHPGFDWRFHKCGDTNSSCDYLVP